jgi:hypothetical protein
LFFVHESVGAELIEELLEDPFGIGGQFVGFIDEQVLGDGGGLAFSDLGFLECEVTVN